MLAENCIEQVEREKHFREEMTRQLHIVKGKNIGKNSKFKKKTKCIKINQQRPA